MISSSEAQPMSWFQNEKIAIVTLLASAFKS